MHEQRHLVSRLNRIQGQIEALKRALEDADDRDCTTTLYQVKAATNALKRFGEAFARAYAKDCLAETNDKRVLERRVNDIISSAFTLS